MIKFTVKERDFGIQFTFGEQEESQLIVEIKNLTQDRGRNVSGSLIVGVRTDKTRLICRDIRIIPTSPNSRQGSAKYLAGCLPDLDSAELPWTDIVNSVCNIALKRFNKVEKIEEIEPVTKIVHLPCLIEPILPLGVPSIIFGQPGSGKSTVAMLMALIAQSFYNEDVLGLTAPTKKSPALYLDFENNRDELNWRWSALTEGMEAERNNIRYLSCNRSLADIACHIRREIKKEGIKLLILDSLLGAAGGNPNDAEPVLGLMNALQSLGKVTTLILAHTAKGTYLKQKKSPFGSVFYEAYARSVWECTKKQKAGDPDITAVLKNTKANRSRLHSPITFQFTYEESSLKCKRAPLNETDDGAPDLSTQITKYLDRKGKSMRVKDIAKELGKGEETIRTTLKRMAKKGVVKKDSSHTWSLKESD